MGAVWGLFVFCVFITHNFISITYNSKYMGSTVEKSIWHCFKFLLPSLNFLIFEWWVMKIKLWKLSYGNWKHILSVFNFRNSVSNGIFVIKLNFWNFSRNVWLLVFFFFSNKVTEWWVPNEWGWEYWSILSDEWRKLSDQKRVVEQKKPFVFFFFFFLSSLLTQFSSLIT